MPLQRPLTPGVGQADQQDDYERRDLDEAGNGDLAEGDRPGVEEDGLNIEDDEEERVIVVLDVELYPGGPLREDAALVGVFFDGIGGRIRPDAELAEEGRR